MESCNSYETLSLIDKIENQISTDTDTIDYSTTSSTSTFSSTGTSTVSSPSIDEIQSLEEKYKDITINQCMKMKNHDPIKKHNQKSKKRSTKTSMDLKQFIHPKLAISFIIWNICYIIMGVFGGSVAFYHFPRVYPKSYIPVPLPDFGYDIIPYWCPLYNHGSLNLQSTILLFFYTLLFVGATYKRNGKGRLIVQQLLHLNSIIFLIRTCTVGITGLPQPNPRCQPIQSKIVTYKEAVQFVMLRGYPPHACGDLIFSGHVACVLLCIVLFHKYNYFTGTSPFIITNVLGLLSILSVISCRSHYTIDVILAFYFVYFVQDWYFIRCNIISTAFYYTDRTCIPVAVKFIAWLEDRKIVIYDSNDDAVKSRL